MYDNKSLENREGYLNLISLFNLHPRTKELCWRLLGSRPLALVKTAYLSKAVGRFGLFRNGATADKAEGLTSPWEVFLVILALFLIFFENIHISQI